MIWLIGNKGMLGSEVEKALHRAGINPVCTDREVDITSPAALTDFLHTGNFTPAWIINCSAYTAVDRAETEREKAFAINGEGVANLAVIASREKIPLLHVSTDYVFDGSKQKPYLENDPVNPASAYGASKLEGERFLITSCRQYYILRTAWLYGINGPNFVSTMLKLFKSRPELKVVADQTGTPTYSRDLAEAMVRIVLSENHNTEKNYGIYHYTNAGATTWYDFAVEISRRACALGLIPAEIPIHPITTAEYPTPARRPANSLLSKQKIQNIFGLNLRSWQEALDDFLANEVKNE